MNKFKKLKDRLEYQMQMMNKSISEHIKAQQKIIACPKFDEACTEECKKDCMIVYLEQAFLHDSDKEYNNLQKTFTKNFNTIIQALEIAADKEQ